MWVGQRKHTSLFTKGKASRYCNCFFFLLNLRDKSDLLWKQWLWLMDLAYKFPFDAANFRSRFSSEWRYSYPIVLKNIHSSLKIISFQTFLQSEVNLNSLFASESWEIAYLSVCLCLQSAIFLIQIFFGSKDPLPQKAIQKALGEQVESVAQLTGAGWANGSALVLPSVGCIFCSWCWPEWENLGSIHRKWTFPDWLIPCWLSSIFLSTTKTFCLVCSCPGPLETVGVSFCCYLLFSFIFQLLPNVSGVKSVMHGSWPEIFQGCVLYVSDPGCTVPECVWSSSPLRNLSLMFP